MAYLYYPGCTLSQKEKKFDDSTRQSAAALGIELVEMPKWYCCGASFSLSQENIMALSAPVRNLLETQNNKHKKLVTMCVFCYHTLKRANHWLKNDLEKTKVLNDFLEDEYKGEVAVLHLLEILRDEIGFENLKQKVKKPLTDLKVAAYYGCLLLRPKEEMQFDDIENPSILENFISSLGATPIIYPQRNECCGSYVSLKNGNLIQSCSEKILKSAQTAGAEVVITSCPMCNYNLNLVIDRDKEKYKIEVKYFTELLAQALGIQ